MAVTFGCTLSGTLPATDPALLKAMAQQAEALGFDSVWFTDHIVIPRTVRAAYPYAVDASRPSIRTGRSTRCSRRWRSSLAAPSGSGSARTS